MTTDASAYAAVIAWPFGRLGIRLNAGRVAAIDFLPDDVPERGGQESAASALRMYLEDPSIGFDLPLLPTGSPFQQRVWQALCATEPGQTVTYGALAAQLGTAARAVGAACRSNPIPIIIPCHRVVSAAGLGGYTGAVDGPSLDIKRWLLEHERRRA